MGKTVLLPVSTITKKKSSMPAVLRLMDTFTEAAKQRIESYVRVA